MYKFANERNERSSQSISLGRKRIRPRVMGIELKFRIADAKLYQLNYKSIDDGRWLICFESRKALFEEGSVLVYRYTGEKPLYFLCLGFIGCVWRIIWFFVLILVYRGQNPEEGKQWRNIKGAL